VVGTESERTIVAQGDNLKGCAVGAEHFSLRHVQGLPTSRFNGGPACRIRSAISVLTSRIWPWLTTDAVS